MEWEGIVASVGGAVPAYFLLRKILGIGKFIIKTIVMAITLLAIVGLLYINQLLGIIKF